MDDSKSGDRRLLPAAIGRQFMYEGSRMCEVVELREGGEQALVKLLDNGVRVVVSATALEGVVQHRSWLDQPRTSGEPVAVSNAAELTLALATAPALVEAASKPDDGEESMRIHREKHCQGVSCWCVSEPSLTPGDRVLAPEPTEYTVTIPEGARAETRPRLALVTDGPIVRRERPPVEAKPLTEIQRMVVAETEALAALLIEKNQAYGNSVLDPVRIFSKASREEQILVRIDDKLSRLARGANAGEDVIGDLTGYLLWLRISRKLDAMPAEDQRRILEEARAPLS